MLWELNNLRSNLQTQSFYEGNSGTRVILVRHGQSTYNAQGRHQGSSDESVLTQAGIDSAQKIGVSLRGMAIDGLYASPLKRAQETAREILTNMGICADDLKLNAHPWDLREIDLHGWQGLALKYVQEQFADDYRCWRQRPHEFRMEVVQHQSLSFNPKEYCFPVIDLYERAQNFWEEILPRHVGQTLLLVGHSGINRALIATALGLTPDRYHAMQQSNCGISILNFSGGDCLADTQRAYHQQAQLEALNLTTQLGEILPKPKGASQGLRLLLVPSGNTNLGNTNLQNINPQSIQKLAKFLEKVSIDFSISGDIGNSQILAEQILQYHPATVQLQVLREDFPQIWQKTIEANNSVSSSKSTSSDRLVTGLVVARPSIIKSLIAQVLGLDPEELYKLQVHQEKISVIHYPSSQQRAPMLQAINISPGEQAITSILDSSVSCSSFMASSTLN